MPIVPPAYKLLAVVILWGASVLAAGWWAYGAGKDAEVATQAREDKAARLATEAAIKGAADAISKIEVKHVTIRQPLETIVRTEQVFHDCRSGPDALRLLNASPGVAQPAGDRSLPAASSPAD